MPETATRPSFGGHEKFVFRHSWLKKGVDAITAQPAVFQSDDALIVLGVGKNMVRSIRHWCLATQMLEEVPTSTRSPKLCVSPLGDNLLSDNGWDPYLEDTASLWLLHWQLATNRRLSFIWGLIFSQFLEPEFTKLQLSQFVQRMLVRQDIRTTQGTVEREVDCFLRMYVPTLRKRSGELAEEALDCPLSELDIIRYSPDDGLYRFNSGPKPSLPVEIFGYSLIQYLASMAVQRRTVHVDECLYGSGSPGQIFRLDENSLVEYLETIEELAGGALHLQETAGLTQIYLPEDLTSNLESLSQAMLEKHYDRA